MQVSAAIELQALPRRGLMAYQWAPVADGVSVYPWVGSGCRELLGLEPEALMADAALFWGLVHPDDRAPLKLAELKAQRQGSTLHHICRITTPAGEPRLIEIVGSPSVPDGSLWYGFAQDISEQQRRLEELGELRQALADQEQLVEQKARLLAEAHAAIVRLSTIDALTGLPNRLHFEHSLMRAVAMAQRHGQPLTLVRLNLLGLRELNGRLGTLGGDQCLKRFADLLAASLGPGHGAARLGGAEFAALLPEADRRIGQEVVLNVANAWAASQTPGEAGLQVASGVAECLAEDSADSMLWRADDGLRRA
jgi:diguanylate cyclase (GGDEF)-like protein